MGYLRHLRFGPAGATYRYVLLDNARAVLQ